MTTTSSPLTEAERQVLIALAELADPIETPNNNFYRFYPKYEEEAALYFKQFRVDWTEAYPTLLAKGLIIKAGDSYYLSEQGVVEANRWRDARPPIFYWYKEFYTLTADSPAYAEFCTRLYGKNLCQANFSDMDQINKLVEVIHPNQKSLMLDIGCGNGLIAEYISDFSGAHITGIDYSPEAIQQARERTPLKHDRLSFQVGNMDDLDFQPHSFDTMISIDTLYMPTDLDRTLRTMVALLKPGGQMAIYYSQMIWDKPDDRQSLQSDHTPLALTLKRQGLSFRTWDYSEQNYHHMQKKRQIGEAMRSDFAAEGHLALYDYIITESESSTAPYNPETCQASRYLYHVLL